MIATAPDEAGPLREASVTTWTRIFDGRTKRATKKAKARGKKR